MLVQVPTTIAAENRDFPEWHHGRESYAVWVLRAKNEAIQKKFKAAREHLADFLLEPYRRQPHITLFVCGFLVDRPQYNDDFTPAQLGTQMNALENTNIQPFEIEVSGLNSFVSAPYLEVHDPAGGIARLRDILSRGAREFRTAPYTPHLTVGLYADAFPSENVLSKLAGFSTTPISWKVEQIALATYQANEFAGKLTYKHDFIFQPISHNM